MPVWVVRRGCLCGCDDDRQQFPSLSHEGGGGFRWQQSRSRGELKPEERLIGFAARLVALLNI